MRLALFKVVGQREDFQACLEHDFVGANARTRRIDDRRARAVSSEAGKRPASRLATAMLMYSFGGLSRSGTDDGDVLPPGIGERDLLGISVGPDLCENFSNRTREYRNGLGLAVPSADQIGILRRAVRYLLAVERVRSQSREHNPTVAQKSQLREREATEKAAAESALLKLYSEILLPGSAEGALALDVVGMGGRPLQTTLDEKKRARIHQRLLELLTTVHRKVFDTVAPGKIVDLFKLGVPESGSPGIQTDRVVAGFFSFRGFPRLHSEDVVRKAIARGVETGRFGYATGRPALDDTGRYQIDRSRVAFERSIADDEIDLDSGFPIAPAALPEQPAPATIATDDASTSDDSNYPMPGSTISIREKPDTGGEEKLPLGETPGKLAISFTASRNDLYAAWPALADMAGRVSVNVKAASEDGLDQARIENGVLEPLRELGLLDDQQS